MPLGLPWLAMLTLPLLSAVGPMRAPPARPQIGAAAAPSQGGHRATMLTILSTNDLHAALDGVDDPVLAGASGRMGGVDRVAGMLARLRAEAPGPVLTVDAGDCFVGDPGVDDLEGRPCADLLRLLGVQVTTLGNHEFDHGDCQSGDGQGAGTGEGAPPPGPRCALARVLGLMEPPVVSANILTPDGRLPPDLTGLKPFVVLDVGGIKVGVTGVLTPDAPLMTADETGWQGIRIDDPVEAVRRVLPSMRSEGAAVVVVLAHLEGECDRPGPSCKVGGELGRLADSFAPGEVDLIVAGHAHAVIAGGGRRVPIIEARSHGRFVGRTRIAVSTGVERVTHGRTAVVSIDNVPVCAGVDPASRACAPAWTGFHGPAPADPDTARWLAALRDKAGVACGEPLAHAMELIANVPTDATGPLRETPMGNLTADLMREAAGQGAGTAGPADMAIVNLGWVRAAIGPGPVTRCDLGRAWPIPDRLVEVSLTGAEVQRMLAAAMALAVHPFALSGAHLVRDAAAGGWRVTDTSGAALVPDRRYRIVTTAFIAGLSRRVPVWVQPIPAGRVRPLDWPTALEGLSHAIEARGHVEAPRGLRSMDAAAGAGLAR